MTIEELKFDANGLIPAVIQDYYTKQVLMVAHMNKESLAITLQEKRTCFFSRSRQSLWLKGETSGNYQHVVSVYADCDADTLVIQVIKDGPACHNGVESCFYNPLFETEKNNTSDMTLDALYRLIEDRRQNPKEGSYTNYLFDKGKEKILKKVGEECTEVVIASMKEDDIETVYEISDLCYHLLVLMAESGIKPRQVMDELASRHVVDHKVKQETMK